MSFALQWMPGVLRAADIKVIEQPGWQTRGHGDMKAVKAILCHHTGGAKKGNLPTLNILVKGRPDLPGPLSQLGLGRDGTFYIIAAGKSYHAGRGAWRGIVDSDNSYMIGIEAENTGLPDDPWPEVQVDAYARGCAALAKHCGLTVNEVIGHKEYAPKRKVDPSFDMAAFRKRVSGFM